MKVLPFILLISIFFANQTRSQQINLPEEIEKYYHELNFINSFSLRDERQAIYTLLSRGKDPSQLKDKRLQEVAQLMKGLMEKVSPFPDPMNAGSVLPIRLLIPEINQLSGCEKEDNHIRLTLHTYSIDYENNMIFIASYSPDQSPDEFEPIDLYSLKYQSQEIHEWYLENHIWKKSSVNKILVE